MWEVPGKKSCLILLDAPINSLLYLVDPSWSYNLFSHRPWNNLPSIVSDNWVILLHHGIYPCGILGFFKRRWLCHNKLAHKSHVSSISVRWLSLFALWCRNSYILCRIHLQYLSFCGTCWGINGVLLMPIYHTLIINPGTNFYFKSVLSLRRHFIQE